MSLPSPLTRRAALKMGAASLVAMAMPAGAAYFGDGPALVAARDAFDHILLGCPDLDAGIRWFEERSGVRARFGGVHPGRGTRNALASLGQRRYLEIIAPDPQQTTADERGTVIRQLSGPRIIGWAVGTNDIEASRRAAEAAGLKTMGPSPGSRQRPDGKMLRWQALGIATADTLVPFFIQWSSDSPHPAADAPPAGSAEELRFESPQAEELRGTLRKMGIDADVRRGNNPRIRLTLATPKGRVEIS